jgi:putative transposase
VHLIQRGVNRVPCFRAESDYLVYLSQLRELCASAEACTLVIHDLGRRYVPYFNRRHDRTGTLWEGRFRSCIVESASYVLACYRYIELNPVRAGMVDHPAAHPWSSYAANCGARPDPSISPHAEFDALSSSNGKRHAAYRGLFDVEMDEALLEAIRDATNAGYPLASDGFKAAVIEPLGWPTGPGKPGPRPHSQPDPKLERRVANLTPN